VEAGHAEEALDLYRGHFPELLEPIPGEFNRSNFQAAVNLAGLMQASGRPATADQLLNGVDRYIQSIPRLGLFGYGIEDVRIQVLQGELEQALASLRTAVNSNWRYFWRYYLDHDPVLTSKEFRPIHGPCSYHIGSSRLISTIS